MDNKKPHRPDPWIEGAQQAAAPAQVQGDDQDRGLKPSPEWWEDPRVVCFLNKYNISGHALNALLVHCQADWDAYETSVRNMIDYAGTEDLLILLSSQAPRLIRTLKIEELIAYLMRQKGINLE